jgi:hypothetical protein
MHLRLSLRIISPLAAVVLASGCASVVNDTMQPLRITTVTSQAIEVKGAACKAENDRGSWSLTSGEMGNVRRSDKDLMIVCTDPSNPDANAHAISRVNAGMFGNIIIGGGIGAVVDHSRGTAYTYPTWMRLEFGKSLVFDRNLQKGDAILEGTSPTATASK